MGGLDGGALGPVGGCRIGEFDGLLDIGVREGDGVAHLILYGERAVGPSVDYGPAVAVLDEAVAAVAEAAVVEAGDDVIAEADVVAVVEFDAFGFDFADGDAVEAGAGVEAGTVVLSAAMMRLVLRLLMSVSQAL
jgi:hypothetical protein